MTQGTLTASGFSPSALEVGRAKRVDALHRRRRQPLGDGGQVRNDVTRRRARRDGDDVARRVPRQDDTRRRELLVFADGLQHRLV